MKFDKHQHTFGGMANVDFSFTLDSCYMRTMTDVCSVFDNWSWGGRGHRPERGLENRFHRWKGMKFTHIGGEGGGWAVANVIGLRAQPVMNESPLFALDLNIRHVRIFNGLLA